MPYINLLTTVLDAKALETSVFSDVTNVEQAS